MTQTNPRMLALFVKLFNVVAVIAVITIVAAIYRYSAPGNFMTNTPMQLQGTEVTVQAVRSLSVETTPLQLRTLEVRSSTGRTGTVFTEDETIKVGDTVKVSVYGARDPLSGEPFKIMFAVR